MEIDIPLSAPQLLGQLMEAVADANLVYEQRFIYSLEYYGGKHLWIRRRGWVFDGWVDIVARDTRVTEENLLIAYEAMRNEIQKEKKA